MAIIPIEALRILDERFGYDNLIAVSTCVDNVPYVRAVNAYYESGAFYIITHAKSNKMQQIAKNPTVAICGDWFTAHGTAKNLGWVCDPKNYDMADKLRTVFDEWYDNGHNNEEDRNTIILRIRLTDGILFHHGERYHIDFTE